MIPDNIPITAPAITSRGKCTPTITRMTAYICFVVFAIFMSSGSLFLSVYKLALDFYLLALFLIGSIEISVIFFNRNIWADIISRIILIISM